MNDDLPKNLVKQVKELDGKQLHELFHLVQDRLKVYHNAKRLDELRQFNILDRVAFNHKRIVLKGTVTKINAKSVSVHTDDDGRWTVSPSLLWKLDEKNDLRDITNRIIGKRYK